MANCRECNVELTDENWHESKKKQGSNWCKSCVSSYQKKRYHNGGKVAQLKYHREQRKINPVKFMLRDAKKRAKQNNMPFNLVEEDVKIPTHCPILGIKLEVGKKNQTNSSPSLDKIIPELGYVKGNVQVISMRANRIKDNASLDELKAICNYIEGHLDRGEKLCQS